MIAALTKDNLHGYQSFSSEFIRNHPQSAVFLDCGLGKTVTTLTSLDSLLFDSFEVRKVLVICPLRVGAVWVDEAVKWNHLSSLRLSVAIGTESERLAALRQKADIHIINRENTQWLIEDSGVPWKWDMLVIDESSSFKNHQSKRFRAIMKARPKVSRVVLLSATPAANNLIDLWAQFRLLDMGKRLGRFIGQYRADYFVPDKRNGQVIFNYKPQPDAESKIYARISDITISMKSTDHLQMPELASSEYLVNFDTKEREKYDKLRCDLTLALKNGEVTAANAAALSGKLCQMANGAVYGDDGKVHHIHNRKLDALEDLIEAANGKSVLVAYWFKHDLYRIEDRLDKLGIRYAQLNSSESLAKWNSGELHAALIHPAAAGHGVNLQSGGSALIWFGLTWSLELYQQTNARLWRQGQKSETVIIQHIITKDTIDQQILRALREKDKTQTALIEAVKANL